MKVFVFRSVDAQKEVFPTELTLKYTVSKVRYADRAQWIKRQFPNLRGRGFETNPQHIPKKVNSAVLCGIGDRVLHSESKGRGTTQEHIPLEKITGEVLL
jgi:hypothetical protein